MISIQILGFVSQLGRFLKNFFTLSTTVLMKIFLRLMSGSCHLDRVLNVKIDVEYQIVIFFSAIFTMILPNLSFVWLLDCETQSKNNGLDWSQPTKLSLNLRVYLSPSWMNMSKRLKDISTLDFSTPSFDPGPFDHRLFNHEFLNHGVEKFMVEKSV